MQRISVLALSTVLLVGLSPAQSPKPERDQRPVLSKASQLAIRKIEKALQGAWRLVDIRLVAGDSVGVDEASLEKVGFMIVSGRYLSIEMHFRANDKEYGDVGRTFVTGIHRFELDEEGRMETSTLIGSLADEAGKPAFEPPETMRHYDVSIEGESLTMTREDGHTLIFERLREDRSRFDFFGTPSTDTDDIYNDDAKKDGEKKKDERDEDG